VIADNSTAALAFDDQKSAGEVLAALRARTHIAGACLFRTDGSLFAEYVRPRDGLRCASSAPAEVSGSFVPEFPVTRPVVLTGQRVGSLSIVSDSGEFRERLRIYGATVLFVLVLSSLLVVMLSAKLRTVFVTPILELARTTATVTGTRDYG